jgi:hypothetical protein
MDQHHNAGAGPAACAILQALRDELCAAVRWLHNTVACYLAHHATHHPLALLVAVSLPRPAAAQTETFRDASGRITGTSSRDANGTVTFGQRPDDRHRHARRLRQHDIPRRERPHHRHGHSAGEEIIN